MAINANKEIMTSCDRCGKCCYQFRHQIHYKDSEFQTLSSNGNPEAIFALFLKYASQWKKDVEGKDRYYVPIKQELNKILSASEIKQFGLESSNLDECMFLGWDANKLPYCRIQTYKPSMCLEYPDSKGGVCLNHKERYYTRRFFDFQVIQNNMPIKVLKEFYREKITDEMSFKLITFMMDFGRFDRKKVQELFHQEFNLSKHDFDHLIYNLKKHELVSTYIDEAGERIESISSREVEKAIDAVCESMGWKR